METKKLTISLLESGAGDGNRTRVRSLGSFYTAIVRRPLVFSVFRLYITVHLLVQTGHGHFRSSNCTPERVPYYSNCERGGSSRHGRGVHLSRAKVTSAFLTRIAGRTLSIG